MKKIILTFTDHGSGSTWFKQDNKIYCFYYSSKENLLNNFLCAFNICKRSKENTFIFSGKKFSFDYEDSFRDFKTFLLEEWFESKI